MLKSNNPASSSNDQEGSLVNDLKRLALLQGPKHDNLKEEAWGKETGVGTEAGLWVWRIQDFKPVAVPKKDQGRFYNGDSYIILKSTKKQDSEGLLHDLHFWLGKETSQDEKGTAAIKSVELDDYLHGAAVQYREVQGRESALLRSYFETIEVVKGGFASGFQHWTAPEYAARLLMVKTVTQEAGKKTRVVVREVEKTKLNSGDVFILDTGKELFQWNGKESAGIERVKAAAYAQGIENERDGEVKLVTLDEGDRDQRKFFEALGGDVKVLSAKEVSDETVYVKKIVRVTSAGTFDEVGSGASAKRSLLESGHVFLLDVQDRIFAWVGKEAQVKLADAEQTARKYAAANHYDADTPVQAVSEGGETTMFDVTLDQF